MRRATFWAPVAAAAFGVTWCGYALRPAGDRAGEMQVVKFGAFPVLMLTLFCREMTGSRVLVGWALAPIMQPNRSQ